MNHSRRPIFTEIALWCVALIFLYPILFVINNSFKSLQQFTKSSVSLAPLLSFYNYVNVFRKVNVLLAFGNSLLVTALTIALAVMLGSMASFALTRGNSRLLHWIYLLFISAIMIPNTLGLIPLYQLARGLHLVNSFIGYSFISTSWQLPLVIFLYVGFMRTVPKELPEAAMMDGCTMNRLFWQIVFPLLKPVTATCIVILFLGVWNDFLGPLLYLQKPMQQTVMLMMFSFVNQYSKDWQSIFPLIVLIMIPVLTVYILLQSQIVKGVAGGSIKG